MRGEDRGVSITVSYVITIGITTILVGGLLITAGTIMDVQRETVTDDELDVIGERFLSEIDAADRMASAGNATEFSMQTTHQATVAGQGYSVSLLDDPPGCPQLCLRLRTHDGDHQILRPVQNQTHMTPSDVNGGSLTLAYDGTTIRLEEDDP